MSSDIAIAAHDVSKVYPIRHRPDAPTTAAEALVQRLKHPLARQEREQFWALRDVSFELEKGRVLGIVGRNGAGKSTLLKALSRVTGITEGRIDLYGRIGSLLEVGTGFHPELTGRENIYLNGSILGMRRKEIDAQFDTIVDFSGVEQFLDTQVKRFSSGMYVRLAFAVAAHLRSEILLVDEVLAVGDKDFRDRCLGKLGSVANDGRTVVFVSHNMESVARLCNQALLLEHGQVTLHGEVNDVINAYVVKQEEAIDLVSEVDNRPGTGELRFVGAGATKVLFDAAEEKVVDFTIERRHPFEGRSYVSCQVVDQREVVIAQCDSRLVSYELDPADLHRGRVKIRSPWLKPGNYRIDLYICPLPPGALIDEAQGACFIEVAPVLPYPGTVGRDGSANASVLSDFSYEVLPAISGDRNLPFSVFLESSAPPH